MRNGFVRGLVLFSSLAAGAGLAVGEGYLRHPDLHGDQVVFVAEGDLWTASLLDGVARRLTSHPGGESLPSFSPDGSRIAFTAQYDGNADVFVVSASGGEPRRLTWHPGPDSVVGWTPDGTEVLFLSSRAHPNGYTEMFAVPAAGGDPRRLPIGGVTDLSIEAAGGRWAFTRTDGGGTWKRYRGGSATTIWVGDPARADYREVTSFDGMNSDPMWHRGRIYYVSDAGGTANLWSMAADGGDRRQHTRFATWDARHPAMGPDGRIVFTLAGDVRVFDPASGEEREVAITLPSDRVLTRVRYPDARRYLTWLDLSDDGERLAITTRGEIFSVPVEDGVTLPVTRGSGARESWGAFDPSGKRLVYVSDATGEEELRTLDAWGRGEPTVVKRAAERGWHFPPVFSPDGRSIAYADETQRLYVVPVGGGAPVEVDRDKHFFIDEYAWSPDSRWLAYSKLGSNDYRSIFVWDARDKRTHRVTDDHTDDHTPAWDPQGRYLYFLSERNTNPLLDTRDLENVNILPSLPFAALLRDDVEHPFRDRAGLPPKEEPSPEGEAKPAKKGKKDADAAGKPGDGEDAADAPTPIEIDFDGIAERVVQLPVPPGQYSGLAATATRVFWISTPLLGMAEWAPLFSDAPPRASLMSLALEDEEVQTFVEGISAYDLAAGADKLAVMKQPGEIFVIGAAAPPGDLGEAAVSLDGVVVEVDPREEWEQIFREGWRHMRDFYWDVGLGGVDWEAVRKQYGSLLPRLATRADLVDLMAEMIGELSTSHTYVFGGDSGRSVDGVATGLLGADLVREGAAFRVERIYRGAPADNERSPLLEPGSRVREGEYIVAVNQLPFDTAGPFHARLEGLAERDVLLSVNDRPTREGARDVVVRPLGSEQGLRYADWVRRNREQVLERSGGKVGYVHIPDMMQDGLIEFNTWFYPQLDREGLVVDVRWNGGGFVSQMILERLRRRVISFDRNRAGEVDTYPYRVLNGPFVVLTNEHAGSDGDIFPAAVQLEGLAPVIGKRSWGGVVGINSLRSLVDGGLLTQPQSAWWDPERGWDLENHGVDPDIEVANLPQDEARGHDAQLERAIEEVLKLHAADPPLEPEFGPVRPRGRGAYGREIAAGEGGGGAAASPGTEGGTTP